MKRLVCRRICSAIPSAKPVRFLREIYGQSAAKFPRDKNGIRGIEDFRAKLQAE